MLTKIIKKTFLNYQKLRIILREVMKNMTQNLVIFSGSQKPSFFSEIELELTLIANNLDTSLYHVWYGGGESGLMAVIPSLFHHRGGQVSSVDARQFVSKFGVASFGNCWVMETFDERQKTLVNKGDIYLCLPGGIGTLSELLDVLVNNDVNGKELQIIIFSYQDFFKDIIHFIYNNIESGFVRESVLRNITICKTGQQVIDKLQDVRKKIDI